MTSFSATHRHVRISPRKVRPLADLIRGKVVAEALEVLRYQPHRGARLLEKVIKSALGSSLDPDNPLNRGKQLDAHLTWVSSVTIDGGPIFKRIRPRARGMAFSIKKRTSHINVTINRE